MKSWALQDAKARLSELVRAAEKSPQRITLHGKEKAVVLSIEEYDRLARPRSKKTLYEIWRSAPKAAEFELPPRKKERMRKIDI